MSDEKPQDNQSAVAIDPRLLEKALKRVRGLVRGNSLDPEQVSLKDHSGVLQYQFGAKVEIKLVPKYGIRLEPGKNTVAELVVSEEDFQKRIHTAAVEARTKPDRRQKIIDFVFSRSDKGFCIESQNVVFRDLALDLVRHEQCQTCAHSGHIPCSRCQGRGGVTCTRCRGTRQAICPKCGGSGHMQTPQGSKPCDYCRADGKVPCPLCHAKGLMKCPACGASGTQPCEKCSGTGWMSHLAHVDIEGQVRFSFERHKIPERLAALIEDRGAYLVSKGDIEVHLVSHGSTLGHHPADLKAEKLSEDKVRETSHEADDLVVINYGVTCPYGPVQFQLGERELSAILLGWQARLIEAPAFLEDMTKVGMQAIEVASTGQGSTISLLRKAAGFAVWQEVLSQILASGNLRKVFESTLNRYSAGLDEGRLKQIIIHADRAVRQVTRKARYLGLAAAMVVYAGLSYGYFWGGGRSALRDRISAPADIGADVLLLLAGMAGGILSSQIFASFIQRQAFSGVIDDNVLRKLPRSGNITWWSLGLSLLIFVAVLAVGVFQGEGDPPEWIIYLMPV
ncbi:MAG TPA: hypothetical protein PKI93_04460 [Alphaproteobacteria bacterium]|nr:hypothetical protein [Alphaproteobacteria bacterium]HNS43665.1 hypothetical protein [Alphaproteobacteria bacterium]